MIKRTLVLCSAALCAFAFSACSTVPAGSPAPTPTATAKTVAAIVEPITQGAVPLVLNKNPSYAPALAVLADAIPAAFASGNLDATSIAGTISLLNDRAKLGLNGDAQALIATALTIGVQQYEQQFGVKVAAATDPNVQLILTSFAQGLHDGVATWQTAHKGS